MLHDPYKALYIHIPFCKSRCEYCDFCTEKADSNSKKIDKYVNSLITEIRDWSKKGELEHIETIYIGGGTPTHLGHKRLVELIYLLSTTIDLRHVSEFCIEANPESLTTEIVKDIYSLGVNRISIGVQSFSDDNLEILGRAHNSEMAISAIEAAKTRFENISIDLMCGLPYQTLESWSDDIKRATELGITHVSVYPLTIEEHTPFYKKCMRGKLPWPDDDLQAEMMEVASEILGKSGFSRYEVASYAKSGFESKHNCSYWSGTPYLGIGKSAVTMTQDARHRMRVQDGRVVEDISRREMIAEDIMLAMRMSKGIHEDVVTEHKDELEGLEECLNELVDKGLVAHDGLRYVPTKKGWLCGNELYGAIFDLA